MQAAVLARMHVREMLLAFGLMVSGRRVQNGRLRLLV